MKTDFPNLALIAACTAVMPASAPALAGPVVSVFDVNSKKQDLTPTPLPDVPAMYAPVVIAQAPKTQPATSPTAVGTAIVERTIGVCQLIANPPMPPLTAVNSMSPVGSVWKYLQMQERLTPAQLTDEMFIAAKARVLQGPQHGELKEEGGDYRYVPTADYLGTDRATILVEMGGYKVKVVYQFRVLGSGIGGTDGYDPYMQKQNCPKGREWRISEIAADFGANDLLAWQRSAELSALMSSASQSLVGVTDLAGSSVAQTTGDGSSAQIVLDTTAAGHGWYVDPTPLDNTDDYLPTSNPNIWQAKAGTDAAGKMDLLTVLLHEYGHALGLEHSADSGDYMAATLQPGQRRLPSAEELQLMSELVAQLKGSNSQSPHPGPLPGGEGGLPLGALLLGRLALGRRSEDAVFDGSRALFAAYPTLQGGSLRNLQDGATQGQVIVTALNDAPIAGG